MSRLLDRPVPVRLRRGKLTGFKWQGRWRSVRLVLDFWRETGCWWNGEAEKDFVQVEAGIVAVLYRDNPSGRWFLHRLFD